MSKKQSPIFFCAAVEGHVDEVIVRLLLEYSGGFGVAGVYGKKGKDWLKKHITGFNNSAKYTTNWFVLVDLNHEALCPPDLLKNWLPNPSPRMFFRIAVRTVESWLLADREHIARFLGVSEKKVPIHPEDLDDPKQEMINLARQSRNYAIREDMVPREGSGLRIGSAYSSRLSEFVNHPENGWHPEIAAKYSDSLNRCLNGIKKWSKQWRKSPSPV